ncbi:MAG: hypothetical protein GY826_10250 [Fuerstiella sp.]|nr:hypothetical protein [Fuerstiella sp.]
MSSWKDADAWAGQVEAMVGDFPVNQFTRYSGRTPTDKWLSERKMAG